MSQGMSYPKVGEVWGFRDTPGQWRMIVGNSPEVCDAVTYVFFGYGHATELSWREWIELRERDSRFVRIYPAD